jgi:anti-sigma28 factor (negative regulator of flagellin synthesis)
MTMRIDGQLPPGDAEAARRLDAARGVDRPGSHASAPRAAGTDRVEVSPELQFVSAAVQAAQEAPAIRSDAIARGREALASGMLGRDTERLAERLIASMLEG